jgi:diacylglycerol O-acyltransferase / wax synthase
MAAPDLEQEALSVVDAAWLRMDRPTNLMMICGMMMLAGRVDLARLKQVIRTRLLCFHRFRQRVADRDGKPRWEFDPNFDLDWHVRRLALPSGGADAGLAELTGDLVSTALDPSKPMWQFHLLDGERGSALVLRIHHCYGDGFALLHVLDAMLDADPAHARPAGSDLAPPGPARSAWERILGPVSETAGDLLRNSLALAGAGGRLLAHPLRAFELAAGGADLLRQAAVIAAMAPDAPTRLKGELGVVKRVAWAEPLSLFEVKALAQAFACSVNDVLVACVTGALRGWLLDAGETLTGKEIRALVPVNLRPPGPVTELGNHFGLVFLELPVGIADPVERMLEVHRRMEALKQSQQPLVALGILAGMGVAPGFIKERVLDALAANASVVITNVRGTAQPRFLAGTRVTGEMFWVPQSGGIGMGVSILSYAGQVSFGVVADTQRVPDPADIPARFASEFELLLLLALVMPWRGEHAATRRASDRP